MTVSKYSFKVRDYQCVVYHGSWDMVISHVDMKGSVISGMSIFISYPFSFKASYVASAERRERRTCVMSKEKRRIWP